MKHTRAALEKMSKEELIDLIMSLEDRFDALVKRMEELERKAARTAAPFSKNRRKMDGKRPGRKVGEGKFEGRTSPLVDGVHEIEVLGVEGEVCTCGGALALEGFDRVSVTDLPERPKVEIKGYDVEIKRCTGCGKQYRGGHKDIAEDQYGATAHRFGRRLLGLAHSLHYEDGIPQRKVPGVLKKLIGVDIS